MISSYHDTVFIDNNDLLTIIDEYRDISHRYGMIQSLFSLNSSEDKNLQINRERFFNIIGSQNIFQRITSSNVFDSFDYRFDEKYFLNTVKSKEYLIDMNGINFTFVKEFDKVDEYFAKNKLYQGKEIKQTPYIFTINAFIAMYGVDYLDQVNNRRVDRLYIYDIYKDSCLYNNINPKYSNSIIDISGLSKPISSYINKPYLSLDDPVNKYEILESIYSILD